MSTSACVKTPERFGSPNGESGWKWEKGGVGMGGNGTHIGSTANVYIVTVSEKLAKSTGNPDLAITPLKWAKKGLPVMVLTLAICTVIMYLFFDYYSLPLHP